MSLIRVLRTTQVVLSHTFYVDSVATDASAGVTVAVKRLDGTSVAAGAAGHPGSPGLYTFTLPAQANVDTLTVDWSGSFGGATVTVRDIVEVVGGFLFGLVEARAMKPPLSTQQVSDAALAAARIGTEQECEDICQQAFVPRFMRVKRDGTGRDGLVMPDINLRAVRSITVNGVAWTSDQLAKVEPAESGVLYLVGGGCWPRGRGNVVVEYEHGPDMAPLTVSEASMLRLRSRLTAASTSVPLRALSFSAGDGGFYRISLPSGRKTGIPDVDAAYEAHTVEVGGFA